MIFFKSKQLRTIFSVIAFCIASLLAAQINYPGTPYPLGETGMSGIPVISMPKVDYHKKSLISNSYLEAAGLKSIYFAHTFDINISPDNDGVWTNLPGGERVWRVALRSAGAYSLNVIFSKFKLNSGASLYIYNPDQTNIVGAFTELNNRSNGTLPVSPVPGDIIIVELQVENGVASYGSIEIGKLNHDYSGLSELKSTKIGTSRPCNLNVSCYQGNNWQLHKNSVVRIIINGNQLCSGVLLNNTANDGRPLLLTANHCINSETKADNSIFYFGYESPFCNGPGGSTSKSLAGSQILATESRQDFTLLELDQMPPESYNPWYAGWDRANTVPQRTVSIHHPNGDVKKIAVDNDSPQTTTFGGMTTNGHWRVIAWDNGTTEGGSSGSPLFDNNGYVRGVLTGGDASCGRSINDYFSKFSVAYDFYTETESQLKPWLDPVGSGVNRIEGINPYASGNLKAKFLWSSSEICDGDYVVFTNFSSGNITSLSWDFGEWALPQFASGVGPHFIKYQFGGTKNVSLTVSGSGGTDTYSTNIPIEVKVGDLPKAGFSYSQNNLSVSFVDNSRFATNYYWEFDDGRISTARNPINNYSSDGTYRVIQRVSNRACIDSVTTSILLQPNFSEEINFESDIRVYPLPASQFIIIEAYNREFLPGTAIEIVDISGKTVRNLFTEPGQQETIINTEELPAGIYLLKLTEGSSITVRLIQILNRR